MDDVPQRTQQPFPDAPYLSPWIAASWRAFRTSDTPPHIAQHRSFDGGTQRLPDESSAIYAVRQDDHRQFDAAERELMELLAGGQVRAKGQPPARDEAGKRLHVASLGHVDIPPSTFLNPQLAFNAFGELIQRLSVLARVFPPHGLHDSNTDPRFPLYHDVLIETAGLRKAWNLPPAEASPARGEAPLPAPEAPLTSTGAIYATGVAGKPTSRQLVLKEMQRRAALRKTQPTMSQEAKALFLWLSVIHPEAPVMTVKTITNSLAAEYRELTRPI